MPQGRSTLTPPTGSGPRDLRAAPAIARPTRLSQGSQGVHQELRKRPRQERARATFEAVLDAAAEAITEHGYAAMTTNAVARRAGVSIGSLYQYFPNKAAILVCLLERHIREMQPVIAEGLEALAEPGRPFEDALSEMLLQLVAVHDQHGPRLQLALSEGVARPPSTERLRRRLEGSYVAEVTRILDRRREFRRSCRPPVVRL